MRSPFPSWWTISLLVFVLGHSCFFRACESLFLTSATRIKNKLANNHTFHSSQSSRVKTMVYTSYSTTSSSLSSTSDSSSDAALVPATTRRLPKIVYFLNAATKWVVSMAVTVGVFWDPRRFQGPYIVVGSIVATYVAVFLKQIIHQGRPEGAPFTDPGMPSSHALVSSFVAMAWHNVLSSTSAGPSYGLILASSAVSVSMLRVVCGYHTVAQIAVGGTLGTLLGHAWMNLGSLVEQLNPKGTFVFAWSAYLIGSAFYIHKNLRRWLTDEKYL